MTGKIGSVTGGFIERAAGGRLDAQVSLRSPHQDFEKLNKAAGIGNYDFWAADEYISTDPSASTVCQAFDVTWAISTIDAEVSRVSASIRI